MERTRSQTTWQVLEIILLALLLAAICYDMRRDHRALAPVPTAEADLPGRHTPVRYVEADLPGRHTLVRYVIVVSRDYGAMWLILGPEDVRDIPVCWRRHWRTADPGTVNQLPATAPAWRKVKHPLGHLWDDPRNAVPSPDSVAAEYFSFSNLPGPARPD